MNQMKLFINFFKSLTNLGIIYGCPIYWSWKNINNVKILNGETSSFGNNLWVDYINKSKIILSIAYYEPSNNDLFRIAPLLSNRCFVISEKCNDEEFNQNPYLLTAEKKDIPKLCEYYVNRPLERLEWINKGYEYIKNNPIKIPIR